MDGNCAQAKVLARAVFELRVLLAPYLGSDNEGPLPVRIAAHLAYALHNEALAVLDGEAFELDQAINKIHAVDQMFDEDFVSRFENCLSAG